MYVSINCYIDEVKAVSIAVFLTQILHNKSCLRKEVINMFFSNFQTKFLTTMHKFRNLTLEFHFNIHYCMLFLKLGLRQRVNVTVIAATNRPDNIDPALLRPGNPSLPIRFKFHHLFILLLHKTTNA